MTYAIEWEPAASRSMRALPEKVVGAVVDLVYGILAERPKAVGKPLRLELAGMYVARRGPYRLIYAIDDDAGVIRIFAVEHRADAYRSR